MSAPVDAYFERLDNTRFRPTVHVGGGWNATEQHIAPVIGLLVHTALLHRDRRRDDDLRVLRVACDIFGVLPLDAFEIEVLMVRPGRTIELVEAQVLHAGRIAATARIWFAAEVDTAADAGTALPQIPPPDDLSPWHPSRLWEGGFVSSLETRRAELAPGRAQIWIRTPLALVADEPVSAVARILGLVDVANGMTVRVPPARMLFPNLDLTAHLFRQPSGDWVGLDTTVSFGAAGAGHTHSVLHDQFGPVGTVVQGLTLRPRS